MADDNVEELIRSVFGDDGYERLVAIMVEKIKMGRWLELEPTPLVLEALEELVYERYRG